MRHEASQIPGGPPKAKRAGGLSFTLALLVWSTPLFFPGGNQLSAMLLCDRAAGHTAFPGHASPTYPGPSQRQTQLGKSRHTSKWALV